LLLIIALTLVLFAAKRLPEFAEPLQRDETARAFFFLLLAIIIVLLIIFALS